MTVHISCYYCGHKIVSKTKVDKQECHGNEDWIRLTCSICRLDFLISELDYDAINKEALS